METNKQKNTNQNKTKNKNHLLIDNAITESDEEALLRSPGTDMDVDFVEPPPYTGAVPVPNAKGNLDAQAPQGPSSMIEGNEHVNKPQQKDYFTGAQKRRIAAQIRDGIEPEEARRREKARYAKILADKKAGTSVQPTNKGKRERSADNSPAGAASKKHRAHEKTRFSPNTSKDKPSSAAKTGSNHGKEANQSRPSTSGGSYRDATAQCKVAIMHFLHPLQTLTERETKLVRKSVLEEMDKADKNCPAIKFVAVSDRDGWLSFTCHDTETKKWLMSTAEKIKPWKDAKLRVTQGNDIPKQHVCVTYVPEDENLTKDIFLNRLGKQNTDLNTKGWRVLRIIKEKSGGYHVTFSVDEKSKDSILKSKCKLFLNFSQIQIRIKANSRQEGTGTQGNNKGDSSKDLATTEEANTDAPTISGSTVEVANPRKSKTSEDLSRTDETPGDNSIAAPGTDTGAPASKPAQQ